MALLAMRKFLTRKSRLLTPRQKRNRPEYQITLHGCFCINSFYCMFIIGFGRKMRGAKNSCHKTAISKRERVWQGIILNDPCFHRRKSRFISFEDFRSNYRPGGTLQEKFMHTISCNFLSISSHSFVTILKWKYFYFPLKHKYTHKIIIVIAVIQVSRIFKV